MYKTIVILLLSLFINTFGKAQSIAVPVIITGKDTLLHFLLEEVHVYAKIKHPRRFARQQERNQKLIYNVRKVLPYAKLAAAKIKGINHQLAVAHSERERDRIVKDEYKKLMETFKQPLTKLTITQGKILVRLIYRETNNTSFEHIKEYKGTINAYFWQSLALLFGNNLKADYEPNGRDYEIEQIVRTIE